MSPISLIAVISLAALMVITTINGAAVISEGVYPNVIRGYRHPGKGSSEPRHGETSTIKVALGSSFNLGCQSFGYPAPSLRWTHKANKDDANVKIVQEANIYGYVTPFSRTSMVKIESNVTVDCVEPHHAGIYTCVQVPIEKGENYLQKVEVVIENDYTENKKSCDTKTAPHIITYAKFFLDESNGNNDAYLPCTAVGNPSADVHWVKLETKEEFEVGFTSNKYIVHSNGALQILDLIWSDMGGYKCVAKNEVGESSISTFVYPLKPKEDA